MTVGVLFCLLNTGTEALKQGKSFPYPYDWDRFPAAWFGGNSTDWESSDQLAEIGKYSMAILGWQHLITATNWTASIYAQLNQAAIIKSHHPDLPVYVYTGFGNADGYNAATWEAQAYVDPNPNPTPHNHPPYERSCHPPSKAAGTTSHATRTGPSRTGSCSRPRAPFIR